MNYHNKDFVSIKREDGHIYFEYEYCSQLRYCGSRVGSLLNETKWHLVSFSLVLNETKCYLVLDLPN